ncbi:MAG: hypothetical protein IKE10_01305 [Bacilli bacterium]|nr:hypothetical protein [Bacilli bacterium]
MKKIIKFLVFAILLFIPVFVHAKTVDIYLFYGDGCPHCAAEEKFLESYLKSNEDVVVHRYEVWYNEENIKLLKDVGDLLGVTPNGVPYTVIGDDVVSGFMSNDTTGEQIRSYINIYRNKEYTDRVKVFLETGEKIEEKEIVEPKKEDKKEEKDTKVSFKLFGKKRTIDTKKVSIPVIAVLLGLVDGFNPCAMWILIFLITMLFNMKNRKKMWILGITFIFTSGLVYLAFMLTWLNLTSFVTKLQYIRLFVAIIALGAGILNLNNYIKSLSKDDGCEVVDDKKRKKIIKRIIKITSNKKFIIALLGIMLLAASVNIIELMCSIGIPMIFTQILSMNDLSTFRYMIYMLIYIFFFLIDDIIIFAISMKTLKVTGISTKYTKYSHLIGGILMIIIGILLLLKPELLMFNF